MSELAFHDTDDLIQELLDRFDHAVFAGVHVGIEGGAADQYFRFREAVAASRQDGEE